jgi:hypothetical protein
MSKCYRCDAEATSDEHVPPKCLFPEKKDLPEVDYRKNLITVPSCEAHNTARSHDDEYLLCVLVASYENNPVARQHFETKIIRLLRRKPWFQTTLMKFLTPVLLNGEETAAFKVDLIRLKRVLEAIAYGLHFHTFKEQWLGEIKVIPLGMFKEEGATFIRHPLEVTMLEGSKIFFADKEHHGENPDIFLYQIHRDLDEGLLVIKMVFYGGFEVVVLSSPKIAEATANTSVDTDAAHNAAQVTP